MTYTLAVRQAAEHDLLEARRWYEAQHRGLGAEFLDEIDRLFERLRESPRIYPQVHEHVRRAVLRRFPYLVFFVVDQGEVVVLACFHASRDPRRMVERLE